MKNILILSLFLSFSTCVKNKYPLWYFNHTDTTTEHLIVGIGNGVNINDAKQKALIDVASQINTKINSVFNTQSYMNSYGTSFETIAQNTNTEVAEIDIIDYKLTDEKFINDKEYIVRIIVSKDILFKNEKINIDKIMSECDGIYRNLLNNNIIQQQKDLIKINDLMKIVIKKVQILISLNNSINNISYYFNKAQDYKIALDKILQRMIFFISSENLEIKDMFTKILNENNIKISTQEQFGNNNFIKLQLKNNYNNSYINNMHIAKGNLSLKCLLNDFNNIVSSNNFECNGVSFVSKEEAEKNCVKNFNEKFKNMKLNDIINFNNKVF